MGTSGRMETDLKALLKDKEVLDDLERKGYRIIQAGSVFKFGMDAVLLSDFASVKPGGRALDLCSGTGIVSLLMHARMPEASYVGLEINPICVDMAGRSAAINGLGDQIRYVEGDVKQVTSYFERNSFDTVTCNPPYMASGSGLTGPSDWKAVSRHEILLDIGDVAAAASAMLPDRGSFFMVHRPFRLGDIFRALQEHGLEPKVMRFVHPFQDAEPNMVLIEAKKGAGSFLKVLSPLVVYEEKGKYSREILKIYGKDVCEAGPDA